MKTMLYKYYFKYCSNDKNAYSEWLIKNRTARAMKYPANKEYQDALYELLNKMESDLDAESFKRIIEVFKSELDKSSYKTSTEIKSIESDLKKLIELKSKLS